MQRRFGFLRHFDWLFFLAVFVLLALGMAAIYSIALSHQSNDFLFIKKQALAILIGGIFFVVLAFSNFRHLRNYSIVLYIFGVALLLGLLFFGSTIRGTTGWYSIFGFNFQPVEFIKLALAVFLSSFFSSSLKSQTPTRRIISSGLIAALPVGLVLLQPDFGSAFVLIFTWFALLYFSGMRWRDIAILGFIFLALSAVSWFFLLADYQKIRVASFLNPLSDPLGGGYNVRQAIIAIGSGAWFGRGLGFGSQSQLKFLPESQTDFIFAVIAEELGFIGVLLVIGAFALLFYRIIRMVRLSNGNFTTFLLMSFAAIFFIQFAINIGMNLGMFPVTGISLPFVSYGGSATIIFLAMAGIIESIAIRSR